MNYFKTLAGWLVAAFLLALVAIAIPFALAWVVLRDTTPLVDEGLNRLGGWIQS